VYDRHDPAGKNGGNSRNGTRSKTVLTEVLRSTVEARFWARDRENMQVGRCERVAEVQIA
jgi:hypothetical protein